MRYKTFWFSSKHYFPKESWFNHRIATRICCYQEFHCFGFYTSICKLKMDSQGSGPTSEMCRKSSYAGRFVKRTAKKDKAGRSKCLHGIGKGWNIPSVWSHAAPDPHRLTTTCSNTLTSNLDTWRCQNDATQKKGAVPWQLVPVLLKLQMETALMGCSTSSKPWDPSPTGVGMRNGSLLPFFGTARSLEEVCCFLYLKCPSRD